MPDGEGCKCGAICRYECWCDDVDWTPSETIALRNDLSEAVAIIEQWLRFSSCPHCGCGNSQGSSSHHDPCWIGEFLKRMEAR